MSRVKKNTEFFNNRSIKASCNIDEQTQSNKHEFTYTSNPNVWGPKFWYILHNCSKHYPKEASHLSARRCSQFILGIPYMLPCGDCRNHAIDYLSKYSETDLFTVCKKQKTLKLFFKTFHNFVNIRLNKPEFTGDI